VTVGATLLAEEQPQGAQPEQPRRIASSLHPADRFFRHSVRGVGIFVLLLVAAIGVFLGYQLIPTIHFYGWHFFTQAKWLPGTKTSGISAAVVGTIEVAIIALAVSFPLAISTALYITEVAPPRARNWLIAGVDLMAAVPSIIYGAWGAFELEPHARDLARWLSEYFGWLPIFKVDADPHAAVWEKSRFTSSVFIAGLAVAMMVTPLACAVMRGVFAQAPIGEREGALALGATRWGMIRSVVLPFGRGGIIGGTMLGLGRALGETVAVLLIIAPDFGIKIRILQTGAITISALIANFFGEATGVQLRALLAAGFVLFVMTLAVNTVAGIVVTRSRSGSATEL
jgi:phosphate transport system permease protein